MGKRVENADGKRPPDDFPLSANGDVGSLGEML
jgi:hypothetical protein